MKIWKLIPVLLLAALPVRALAVDYIHDDYVELKTHTVRAMGWLTYGFHSNTFHLRRMYLRYNLQLPHIQFFATLSGYKDTHDPATNYGFVLPNVNLYDFGANFLFFDLAFLSLRGAAVYRLDTETWLLLPAYRSTNNPAEFDAPPQYRDEFLNAAGIRAGIMTGNFEVGYSQGDWRHSIPMAVLVKYTGDWFEAKAVLQLHNADPFVYEFANYRARGQANFRAARSFGKWTLRGLAEFSMFEDKSYTFRFEEAVEYDPWDVRLAFRQIACSGLPALFEVSLTREFDKLASIGIFAATDGRVYIGTSIDI